MQTTRLQNQVWVARRLTHQRTERCSSTPRNLPPWCLGRRKWTSFLWPESRTCGTAPWDPPRNCLRCKTCSNSQSEKRIYFSIRDTLDIFSILYFKSRLSQTSLICVHAKFFAITHQPVFSLFCFFSSFPSFLKRSSQKIVQSSSIFCTQALIKDLKPGKSDLESFVACNEGSQLGKRFLARSPNTDEQSVSTRVSDDPRNLQTIQKSNVLYYLIQFLEQRDVF